MKFKIDTKEKLVIFSPETAMMDAILADELKQLAFENPAYVDQNLILDLHSVTSATPEGIEAILAVYQHAYAHAYSCCLTGITPAIAARLQAAHAEFLNITPTLSEAIDIVMMEELERELSREDDDTVTPGE